jgi:predicted nucleic acid-binding protein
VRYILDTNTLSEILRNGQSSLLGARVAAIPDERTNVRITVITFQEMLAGRIIDIGRTIKEYPRIEPPHLRYSLLEHTYVELLRYYPPLPFDVNAQAVYDAIPPKIKDHAKIRDCRIASIQVALGKEWTVITADQKDFRQIEKVIPVQWDDWTFAPLT